MLSTAYLVIEYGNTRMSLLANPGLYLLTQATWAARAAKDSSTTSCQAIRIIDRIKCNDLTNLHTMHMKRNRHHPVLRALGDGSVRHRSLGPAVAVDLVLLRVNEFGGDLSLFYEIGLKGD